MLDEGAADVLISLDRELQSVIRGERKHVGLSLLHFAGGSLIYRPTVRDGGRPAP
jgi:hypothetical protein